MQDELCYFRIEKFKYEYEASVMKLEKRDFIFSSKYNIYFENGKITFKEKNNIKDFFSISNNTNISNITALIGKNGSGKTYILNALSNFFVGSKYKTIDAIIIMETNGIFKIISKEKLIKSVEGIKKEKYELIEYSEEESTILNVRSSLNKICQIYFSNAINIRNKIFQPTSTENNYYNISLQSNLSRDLEKNQVGIIKYYNKFYNSEEKFRANKDIYIVSNDITKKNLVFLLQNDYFEVRYVELLTPFYFIDLYNYKSKKDLWRKYKKNITQVERIIYKCLEMKLADAINEREKCILLVHFAMIDLFFDELYGKIVDGKILNEVNHKINLAMNVFNQIQDVDYLRIYNEVIYILQNIEVEEKFVIENVIKKYKKFEMIFNKLTSQDNQSVLYKTVEKPIWEGSKRNINNIEPRILVNKDAYKILLEILKNEAVNIFEIRFAGLSSGEQAKLDIYSELYNIKNKIKSDSVIVYLDEPELYFHPEWQRRTINMLIEFFNKYYKDKSIQIILTSNSPYILSDLTKENVILFGKENENNTFGKDIYSILKDEYFMESTIGEFAQSKIERMIKKINSNVKLSLKKYEEYKKIINNIGEPMLKNKLNEMLEEKYGKN